MAEANYLEITPTQLTFPVTTDKSTLTSTIVLKNITSKPISFKVKTTNPKRYIVRPNYDVIPPNESSKVSVILNYQTEQPRLEDKDKFQIQSIIYNGAPNPTHIHLKEQWTFYDDLTIKKQRITCKFIESESSQENQSGDPTNSSNLRNVSPKPEQQIQSRGKIILVVITLISVLLSILLGMFFYTNQFD